MQTNTVLLYPALPYGTFASARTSVVVEGVLGKPCSAPVPNWAIWVVFGCNKTVTNRYDVRHLFRNHHSC